MVQFMKIAEITPLREISTERQGRPSVFYKQGFRLTDGVNSIYGETMGEYAKAVLGLKLEKGMTVAVNLDFSARSYPDKNGEIRFENQVRITNIAPFSV
jgi:hypothetical protein